MDVKLNENELLTPKLCEKAHTIVTFFLACALGGVAHLCSIHERSLAALLLDLVALKLLGQKQGFITCLLVAWRGLCLHNACFSLALFS